MSERPDLRVISTPGIPASEAEARERHEQIVGQLSELRHGALFVRAREIAQDFKAPSRHQGLSNAEWCCLATRMVGDVADQVFGLSVIGGPRPARQARSAIERAIALLLVLDDSLADLEDDAGGSAS